jgi:hypothetical protein
VACSNNSRNGIFDLPITPGEELEVIDTTEQNLVICRNSKGKCKFIGLLLVNFQLLSFKKSSSIFYESLRLVFYQHILFVEGFIVMFTYVLPMYLNYIGFCFYRWICTH